MEVNRESCFVSRGSVFALFSRMDVDHFQTPLPIPDLRLPTYDPQLATSHETTPTIPRMRSTRWKDIINVSRRTTGAARCINVGRQSPDGLSAARNSGRVLLADINRRRRLSRAAGNGPGIDDAERRRDPLRRRAQGNRLGAGFVVKNISPARGHDRRGTIRRGSR